MRTTVTLDDDTLVVIRRLMRERNMSFEDALNDAIRQGAQRRPVPAAFEKRTADLSAPSVNLDRVVIYHSDFGRFDGVLWEIPDSLSG